MEKQENPKIARKSSRSVWLYGLAVIVLILIIGLGIGLGLRSNGNKADSSKMSWPELVGMDADEAMEWLQERYPDLKVYVLDYGDVASTEYDVKRVRIYKSPNGTTVIVPPKLGR
jgi:Potato inhibitor I family